MVYHFAFLQYSLTFEFLAFTFHALCQDTEDHDLNDFLFSGSIQPQVGITATAWNQNQPSSVMVNIDVSFFCVSKNFTYILREFMPHVPRQFG